MAKKKMTKEQRDKCRVLTPVFRLSYPHLFKPHAMDESSKKKYSLVMLFAKNADLSGIKKAMKAAKTIEYGAKENWPEELESPVSDGDDSNFSDREGYAGHYAIKATSNEDQKPGVVDANCDEILDQADIYPGCYCRASILAYPWTFGKKQGIGFILDHVQKVKEGKPFSSKPSASSVFGAIEADDEESEDDGF